MLRSLRNSVTLLLPLLAAACIWMGSSCNRNEGGLPANDVPPDGNSGTAGNRPAPPANSNPDPDADALTDEQKKDVYHRLNIERPWWNSIQDLKDPAERFAYMSRMLDSMRFFLQHGAWQLIQTPMGAQVQKRSRQPVFLALHAALVSMTPPPVGTPESRAQAVQGLGQALRIEDRAGRPFAHAHYLLGYVLLMDQRAMMTAGKPMDRGAVQAAAQHFTDALELRDDFPDAWAQLAMASSLLDDATPAIECSEKAIAADPSEQKSWAQLLAILQHFDRLSEMESRLTALIAAHSPTAGVRLVIYGQLAEHLANGRQFEKAWNFMKLARDAAAEAPTLLREGQWIDIYSALARLAVMKPQSEPDVAADYLREAANHARLHKLSLMRVITAWTEVLSRVTDPQVYLPELLDMCFEVMGTEALNDVDRARLTAVIAQFLGRANLATLERARLWQLLAWTLDQVQLGNDQLLELSIQLAQALLPIKDDANGRPRIDPALLEDADENTVRTLVAVLCNMSLESTEYRVTLPGCDVLGHLLTASRGTFDSIFVERAIAILQRPVTRDQNQRKSNVGEVLVRHPVEDLGRHVIGALQAAAAVDQGAGDCLRMFPIMHRALNAIYDPDLEPAWTAGPDTTIAEYRRLAAAWNSHVQGNN